MLYRSIDYTQTVKGLIHIQTFQKTQIQQNTIVLTQLTMQETAWTGITADERINNQLLIKTLQPDLQEALGQNKLFFFSFFVFDFCRFCVVNRLFHPRHNGQSPPTSKYFYTRFYPLHYFRILILLKEPVFPFSMLSAKQGNYWYYFITSLV